MVGQESNMFSALLQTVSMINVQEGHMSLFEMSDIRKLMAKGR